MGFYKTIKLNQDLLIQHAHKRKLSNSKFLLNKRILVEVAARRLILSIEDLQQLIQERKLEVIEDQNWSYLSSKDFKDLFKEYYQALQKGDPQALQREQIVYNTEEQKRMQLLTISKNRFEEIILTCICQCQNHFSLKMEHLFTNQITDCGCVRERILARSEKLKKTA